MCYWAVQGSCASRECRGVQLRRLEAAQHRQGRQLPLPVEVRLWYLKDCVAIMSCHAESITRLPTPFLKELWAMTILTRECGWRLVSVEVAAAAEESEESVVKALAQEKKVPTPKRKQSPLSRAMQWPSGLTDAFV